MRESELLCVLGPGSWIGRASCSCCPQGAVEGCGMSFDTLSSPPITMTGRMYIFMSVRPHGPDHGDSAHWHSPPHHRHSSTQFSLSSTPQEP